MSSYSSEMDIELSYSFFEELPNKILSYILSFCDRSSLRNMAAVNKRFKALVLRKKISTQMTDLPLEIIIKIFSFLNKKDLARVAQVNSYFRELAYVNSLWRIEAQTSLVTNFQKKSPLNSSEYLSARDRVRISKNWNLGIYSESKLLIHDTRYMPRIQLTESALWISLGNRIWSHQRNYDGTLMRTATHILKGHTGDVSRFVIKNGIAVSGGQDRTLMGWNADSGNFLFSKRYCHQSEVSAVDIVSNNLVITGSRDQRVKLWLLNEDYFPTLRHTINIMDRIWSVAANPFNGRSVIVGSAGLDGVPALNKIDTETGRALFENGFGGPNLRRGAGMLDLKWQTENTFLSCGYDSCTRLWDIRTRLSNSVRTWEEPHDEAIYCLATDNNFTLLCGTARHGLVRLWDMRQQKPIQLYYAKHAHAGQSSPVYSIDFDSSHLYVALDQCLNLLSFNGFDNRSNYLYRTSSTNINRLNYSQMTVPTVTVSDSR